MKVYGDINSGNCFKIKYLLDILNRDSSYEWIEVDILNNETHSVEFLQKNPNGKIPLLELDDGRCLSESNAILTYLAQDTHWLPEDRYDHAKVMQWLFFEQYSHEPYIAVARYIAKYLGLPEDRRAEYESKQTGGHKALQVMETQLARTAFLVAETPTIADISLFAYTRVADEGGFDLSIYPHINRWLGCMEDLTH
ncbi:MAG: glutathione S-transferase family protein [bacterium]